MLLTFAFLILNSHRKIEKWSEQKLRQTRRRTQAGLTPGKDDNEVWHHFCRSRLKVSMGVQYKDEKSGKNLNQTAMADTI